MSRASPARQAKDTSRACPFDSEHTETAGDEGGTQTTVPSRWVHVSQETYAKKVVEKFGFCQGQRAVLLRELWVWPALRVQLRLQVLSARTPRNESGAVFCRKV